MTTQGTESTPTTPPSPPPPPEYAIRFDVPYPEAPRDKVSVALRIFMVIPIAFVLSTIAVGSYSLGWLDPSGTWTFWIGGSTGILFVGPALMTIFRQKYPRWWFDFNLELLRFGARVSSYLVLLRDEYPATDEHQAVRLDADYPDVSQLNRWLPIVKWLLVIPHYIVLFFLFIGALIAIIVAWFSILITGEYPRGLYNYVVGVMRWNYRVTSYAFLLTTDEYPPFSLE